MKTITDLSFRQFGRLFVICHEKSTRTPNGTSVIWWLCRCNCGNLALVSGANLRNGNTKSCGCYQAEVEKIAAVTHGGCGTPEYQSWRGMRERCSNPRNNHYHSYGGRGITVCDRWNKFENFLADMGARPADKTLDRKNNDGNYEPSNCRWATDEEQRGNKNSKTHGHRLSSVPA